LSHINAFCINQSYYPKDQSVKFSRNFFENWRFWKSQFFWVSHFEFFVSKFFFFCFIPMKISLNLYGRMNGSKFWCFPWFLENSLLCAILRYTVYLRYFCTTIWIVRCTFGSCYIQHHAQTIHPTEKIISMNLLQMSSVITWAWSFLTSEVVEAVRG
jgi:hypothetical protein